MTQMTLKAENKLDLKPIAQIAKRLGITVSYVRDPFYTEANKSRLRKSIEQLNGKRGVEHKLVENYD